MKSSAYDIKPATSVLDPSLKIETCLEHPGEPNVYFCIDCNSLCCAYCILVGNHTRHSYTTRENAPQFISSTLRKAFSDIYYRFQEGTREFESLTMTTQSKLVLLEKDLSAVEEKMAELSEQRICLRNRLSSICSDAHEEHRHFADHFRAILAETKHCYEVCRAQDAQVWNPTASVYADIASLLSQIDRYHKHVVSEANRLEVRKGLTVEMIKRSAPTTLPRHNVTEFQYPIPCHHESYKIASLEERSKNACDDKRETKDSRYDDVMDYVSSRFRSKVPVQNPTLCSNHDSISPERRTVVPGTGQTQTNPCSVVSRNSSPQDTPSNTSPSFPMRNGGGKQDNFARRSRSTEEGRKLRDAVRTPVDSQVRKEFLESSTQKKEKKVQNRQHTPPNRVPGEILATPQRKVKKNSGPTVQQYQRLVSCLWDASHVRSSNTQKAILSAIAFMKDEAEKWKAHDVLDKINRDKDIVRAIRKLSPHPQSESADHMPVHTRR